MLDAASWRVTPRDGSRTAAYGYVWPGDGCVVTADEFDADTLQRLDADRRFLVEALERADASPRPPDPKPTPKPRRRRS